jgi:acyl dehydratase
MAKQVFQSAAELRARTGEEVAVSEWHTVTQEEIDQFAAVTQDQQWIHVDRERAAAESPYKTTIAHGFLTLSMLSKLSRESVELAGDFKMRINYGLNKVRFPSAVPSGSRIRARFAVGSVEALEGAVQVIWKVTVEVEGAAKPACVAEWVIRCYF